MLSIGFIIAAQNSGLPVNQIVIIGAIATLALLLILGSFWLFRSNGKKKGKAKDAKGATGGASDWQRQPQGAPGAPGAWNPQQQGMSGAVGGWGAPSQPVQGQPGGWGAPSQPVQGQQPASNAWGAPSQPAQGQQGSWGAPSQPAAQGQQGSWGAPSQPAAQGQPGGWGASGVANQSQPAWGMPDAAQQQQQQQQPASNAWGAPSGNQAPTGAGWGGAQSSGWEPTAAASSQPQQSQQQDPWGQQAASAPAWGAQQSAAQQPQSSFGAASSAPSWGQPAQSAQPAFGASNAPAADPWAAAAAPPVPAPAGGSVGNPSWQQGGFGQSASPTGAPDSEKTMLRSGPVGAQTGGGTGIVRVEEGKEPGRIYEVRKDTLSIGRSRESDIFLEDLAVSRLHASIVNMGNGGFALKDEGSANGTKVNGQLVNKYQTYPLQEGDRIQLGQTVLVFARR